MSNLIYYNNLGPFVLGPIPDTIPTSEKIAGYSDANLNTYWAARKFQKI